MIKLENKDTGEYIGMITEEQLKFLVDELVEENETDQDYYINRNQLETFETKGVDAKLYSLLRIALGDSEDMEIVWTRE